MNMAQANKNIEMFGVADPDQFLSMLKLTVGHSNKDSITLSMLSDVQELIHLGASEQELNQRINLVKYVISEI